MLITRSASGSTAWSRGAARSRLKRLFLVIQESKLLSRVLKIMPLIDRLCEQWQRMRAERTKEIADWLKKSDKSSEHSDYYYQLEAQKRISGFRWQFYRLASQEVIFCQTRMPDGSINDRDCDK